MHVKKGLPCVACHGKDMKIEEPTIEQCRQCHQPDALARKTASVKPQNPHVSPHYGNTLDCVNCHHGHEEPEVYCNQCHKFPMKVR